MKISYLALVASLVATPALAETNTTQSWTANTIVVTGKRETYAAPNSGSATRTDTPLIEVPQSVQVLTRSLIEEQDRRTLGDALINVSGVVPTRSEEQLLIAPLVRGFPAEVYLDGLPIYAGNQQAFDPTSLVGRADRGAQGTQRHAVRWRSRDTAWRYYQHRIRAAKRQARRLRCDARR